MTRYLWLALALAALAGLASSRLVSEAEPRRHAGSLGQLHAIINGQSSGRGSRIQDYFKQPHECPVRAGWPEPRSTRSPAGRHQPLWQRSHCSKLAPPGLFPAHVGIVADTRTAESVALCGGTLLTSNIVLTAAHCLQNKTNFRLAASTHHPFRWPEFGVLERRALHACQSRQLKGRGLDFGVIILDRPLKVGGSVQAACLADRDIPDDRPVYTAATGARGNMAALFDYLDYGLALSDGLRYAKLFEQPCQQPFEHPGSLCTVSQRNCDNLASHCIGTAGGGIYGLWDGSLVLHATVSKALSGCRHDRPGTLVNMAVNRYSNVIKGLAQRCLAEAAAKVTTEVEAEGDSEGGLLYRTTTKSTSTTTVSEVLLPV